MENLNDAKAEYLRQLRQMSPSQPESWYLAQLARQPFVRDPEKFGYGVRNNCDGSGPHSSGEVRMTHSFRRRSTCPDGKVYGAESLDECLPSVPSNRLVYISREEWSRAPSHIKVDTGARFWLMDPYKHLREVYVA